MANDTKQILVELSCKVTYWKNCQDKLRELIFGNISHRDPTFFPFCRNEIPVILLLTVRISFVSIKVMILLHYCLR